MNSSNMRNWSILYFIGLSPDLQSMEQIRRIMRPTDVPDTGRFDNKTFWYYPIR